MANERSVLGVAQNRLTIFDRRTARLLDQTIEQAAADSVGAGTVLELVGPANERYLAHVLPLTSGRRRRAHSHAGAVAAVFVREAGIPTVPSLEVVTTSFGLTPAEVRVLHALVLEAKGVAAIAAITGIAESTVKTHLRHLFRKTGTSRQSELVKLVASYASAVGDKQACCDRSSPPNG